MLSMESSGGEGDPLVVEFDEDGGGEPVDGAGVREDLDDVGTALDLPVQSLEWVG